MVIFVEFAERGRVGHGHFNNTYVHVATVLSLPLFPPAFLPLFSLFLTLFLLSLLLSSLLYTLISFSPFSSPSPLPSLTFSPFLFSPDAPRYNEELKQSLGEQVFGSKLLMSDGKDFNAELAFQIACKVSIGNNN